MRLSALVLVSSLLLPGAALAGGKGKAAPKAAEKSKKGGSTKPSAKGGGKPAKNPTNAVAGALSDSDRPVAGAAPTPNGGGAPTPKGPQRIDFDDRVIEGQSNKSGAVYLYDRKDLQVDSMVKQPTTFRSEIAKGLFE